MTMFKHAGILVRRAMIDAFCLELRERLSMKERHDKRKENRTMRKRIGIFVLTAAIAASCLGLAGQYSIPVVSNFITAAQAYVNRTVSPVRVQNTARADWSGCIPSIGGC